MESRREERIFTWEDGQRRLFDLTQDPAEQVDLYTTGPDAEALWDLLAPRVDALDEMIEGVSPAAPGRMR